MLGTPTLMSVGAAVRSLLAPDSRAAGDWMERQPAFASGQRYVAATVLIGLGVTTALSGSRGK